MVPQILREFTTFTLIPFNLGLPSRHDPHICIEKFTKVELVVKDLQGIISPLRASLLMAAISLKCN